jgi:hypothetical protein
MNQGKNQVFGLEILREAEREVQVVRENPQLAQSRQKSYADHRRRKLSFEVGDFVYLKVSPMRGLPFQDKRKDCTKICWIFQDFIANGEVAY